MHETTLRQSLLFEHPRPNPKKIDPAPKNLLSKPMTQRKIIIISSTQFDAANLSALRALAAQASTHQVELRISDETTNRMDEFARKIDQSIVPDAPPFQISSAQDSDWKKERKKQWRANLTRHHHPR
jgi:hypothetical protein